MRNTEAISRLSDIQYIPSVRKNTGRLDVEKVLTDFFVTRFQAVNAYREPFLSISILEIRLSDLEN